MHRAFDPAPTRRRRVLNGRWDFVIDPDDVGVNAGYGESFPAAEADRIDVPLAWNAVPAYYEYHGPAWYRRTFTLPTASTTRVAFLGVCTDATVWLDGDRIADHYGGYTPFEAVVDLDAGEHELVVRADNRRDDRSLPSPGTDWFPYGGITREVVVESVPTVSVRRIDVDYDLDGDSATATVFVEIDNRGDATSVPIEVTLGNASRERTVDVESGGTSVDVELTTAVEKWSIETPNCYEATARVGRGSRRDVRRERVGFRTVELTDSELLLNGEPIELRGVNRHEDHPDWGHAQPQRLQELDLDLITSAGFNVVRTSHYPNHPRFLDLCDEHGVLVVEDLPYWGFDAEQFETDRVLERGKTMLREMIERDRTHPSILAWSVTNECANRETAVYDATNSLVDLARSLDDRPVTLASNNYHPDGDGEDHCIDLVDFACINAYPGWYDEGDYADVVSGVRDDYPDKPIVVSEFGAGAVYGERTRENQKWSEGFQADFLVDAIETIDETDVAGFVIWQYADTRTSPLEWERRPKTKNNKGIVDEYRRPKSAYDRVSDVLRDDT